MTATPTRTNVALVLVLSACLCGCTEQTSTVGAVDDNQQLLDLPAELAAQVRPPILDLPVPVGFRMDERRSRDFAAAGARYVDHVYKGRSDKFAVGRFYKRNMPRSRWVLVTDMFVQGDIMLDFEKQTERCRIIVAGGDLIHTVHVKAQLWTTGRIQALVPPEDTARRSVDSNR
ncbi:MAG TPA: hypothetical protein VFJ30_11775 [Phycisphaerae bacterium]|nr:hypothetical protein [Phycisphaerae bacterium]